MYLYATWFRCDKPPVFKFNCRLISRELFFTLFVNFDINLTPHTAPCCTEWRTPDLQQQPLVEPVLPQLLLVSLVLLELLLFVLILLILLLHLSFLMLYLFTGHREGAGSYPSCTWVKAGSSPGWVTGSSQGPMWAIMGLIPCLRVPQHCSESVLAHPLPIRPPSVFWTENPPLLDPVPNWLRYHHPTL